MFLPRMIFFVRVTPFDEVELERRVDVILKRHMHIYTPLRVGTHIFYIYIHIYAYYIETKMGLFC